MRGARGLPVAALAAVLAGCAAAGTPAAPPSAGEPPRVEAPAAAPASIAQRIAELEAARATGKDADPGDRRGLELALLYTHPANPSPDHARALVALRAHLAAAPQAAGDVEIGRLLRLLEAIERLGRAPKDAKLRERDLAGQVRTLQQDLAEGQAREADARRREAGLLEQIKILQRRIEQLQKLDLEMEQRRRSVR